MLDRVTGMQVFVRVAALGSLSAAARALGMSQTMATKHDGSAGSAAWHQADAPDDAADVADGSGAGVSGRG